MNCPIDGAELRMTEREGVEIDYCPKCRGVWLDRGELDKILDRAEEQPTSGMVDDRYDRDREHRPYDRKSSEHYRRHKRESVWSRIFDFD